MRCYLANRIFFLLMLLRFQLQGGTDNCWQVADVSYLLPENYPGTTRVVFCVLEQSMYLRRNAIYTIVTCQN